VRWDASGGQRGEPFAPRRRGERLVGRLKRAAAAGILWTSTSIDPADYAGGSRRRRSLLLRVSLLGRDFCVRSCRRRQRGRMGQDWMLGTRRRSCPIRWERLEEEGMVKEEGHVLGYTSDGTIRGAAAEGGRAAQRHARPVHHRLGEGDLEPRMNIRSVERREGGRSEIPVDRRPPARDDKRVWCCVHDWRWKLGADGVR